MVQYDWFCDEQTAYYSWGKKKSMKQIKVWTKQQGLPSRELRGRGAAWPKSHKMDGNYLQVPICTHQDIYLNAKKALLRLKTNTQTSKS